MFEKWFQAFQDAGSGNVQVDTEVTTGDNGQPEGKDLGFLLDKVITDDDKLRIVVSS